MKNTIREALMKDIVEMLDCVTNNDCWEDCLEHFEYEFMIDRDGQLAYEQWSDSCEGGTFVEMDECPLFQELKDLGYTGVCHVKFSQDDKLILEEDTEDYVLEVALTNATYHSPNESHHDPVTDTGIIDFTAGGYEEDERYFFPLTRELELKCETETVT